MIGEIWCATLMELGRTIGTKLTMQIVIDALKLSPQNPSFLDMRDAILAALSHKQAANQLNVQDYPATTDGLWKVFARFGMGPNARCDGPNLTGIVADFGVPSPTPASPVSAGGVKPNAPGPTPGIPGAKVIVNLPIPDKDPRGVSSSVTTALSGVVQRISVTVDIEHPFVGDLRVSLSSPDGRTSVLQDQEGFNAVNLQRTFTSEAMPALAALIGAKAGGVWTLNVADLARLNVGTFRSWGLDCQAT
jgi:extracellular elastinolytic metalloproteinase